MPLIYQLPLLAQVSPGDQIPVYTPNNGDARRMPVSELLRFFQANFASPQFLTQFATPGTGFNIAIQQTGTNVWLLLQPAGGLLTGTITMPLNTAAADGQEIMVTSTQQINVLSVGLNGAAAQYGFPNSIAANGFFKMRYYLNTNSWYRVG